ncbi:MAG: hypothetical protein ACK4K7_03005 [Allosphingosinicella sp.]|uniref:hypothetical protein n=1 Tax=Allosphingosinicella sp. TaxID=2823234 RepID=UPI0039640CD6
MDNFDQIWNGEDRFQVRHTGVRGESFADQVRRLGIGGATPAMPDGEAILAAINVNLVPARDQALGAITESYNLSVALIANAREYSLGALNFRLEENIYALNFQRDLNLNALNIRRDELLITLNPVVAQAEAAREAAITARDIATAARDVTLGYRDATLTARDVTLGYRNDSQTAAGGAVQARIAAETARDVAQAASLTAPNVYGTVAAGNAAVVNDATFWVGGSNGIELYRKVAGNAVLLDTLLSAATLEDQGVPVELLGVRSGPLSGAALTASTNALEAAMWSGRPLLFKKKPAVYLVDRPIARATEHGSDIDWRGDGTIIRYAGAARVPRAIIRVNVTGRRVTIHGIEVDADNKCGCGWEIENTAAHTPANLSVLETRGFGARNTHRLSGDDSYGDGVRIRGAFSRIECFDLRLSNIHVAAAGVSEGSVGAHGFTTVASSAGGYAEYQHIEGGTVEDVYCDDPSVIQDQDGIRLTALQPDNATPYPAVAIVRGVKFKNCRGREVKTQIKTTVIEENQLVRDVGTTTAIEKPASFGIQRGDGFVRRNEAHYSGGQNVLPSAFVQATGSATVNPTIVVEENVVHVADGLVLPRLVQNSPNGGAYRYIEVEKNRVFGEVAEPVRFLTFGDTNFLRVARNFFRKIALGITANATDARTLVTVVSGGAGTGATPRFGLVEIESNIYGGTEEVHVARDNITGLVTLAAISSRGNIGFLDDATASAGVGSGLRRKQIWRSGASGPPMRSAADAAPSRSSEQAVVNTLTISAAATATVSLPLAGTACKVEISCAINQNGGAEFWAGSSGTVPIHLGSEWGLGNTSEPATGNFRAWVGTNQLNIKNNSGSSRRFAVRYFCQQ